MELAFLNGDFSPSNQYNSIQEYINQIGCSSFISSNVHKFKLAWGKRNDGGLHPDAWHQKPSINDVCRLHEGQWSEDIEDVRISQSGLPTLSGPRRAQWLPPPAGRGQYSYGYPGKLRRKILGSILDSSDFFALSYFCTLQNVWNMRCLTEATGKNIWQYARYNKKAVDILKNVHPWEQDYGGYQHFYPDYSYNYSSPVHTQSHRHKRVFTDDISLGKPDVQ